MEEVRVVLAHGVQQFHVFDGAVHHGAAVGRDDAVGKVEAAFNGALQQGAAGFAEEVGHVVGCDVHGASVGRVQPDAEGPRQIHQRLRDVFAGVGDTDLAFGLCLGNQLIVRHLQEVLEVLQMLEISHGCVYSPCLLSKVSQDKKESLAAGFSTGRKPPYSRLLYRFSAPNSTESRIFMSSVKNGHGVLLNLPRVQNRGFTRLFFCIDRERGNRPCAFSAPML